MSDREIFDAALAIADPARRSAYLDQACAGDAARIRQIKGLLEMHAQLGSFLESPAGGLGATADSAPPNHAEPETSAAAPAECPGAVIGPYKLLQQIGEGGMGTVFMAEQVHPVQRKVAVKIIKPGMDSRQVIARFEAERQALALMDHPNIAKVLDAGTTKGGRPYFVMELVKGVPITQFCDQHRLTPKERLELFVPVCQAIQHAHHKGIIHRDIKPSNVLVCIYDGKPVPKVIDFGVAKATGSRLTEQTLYTEFGAIVGTVEYMSPEQAQLDQLDIDTRSDIYSLGVLLYELLTGTTPLEPKRMKEVAILELLRLVREEEAPRPSTRLSTADGLPSIAANRRTEPKKLSALMRGELDWIVLKALEKDRNRRYETPNGMAQDIERHLHDEAVQACPPSAGYRLRKFVRRNKGPVAAASLIVLSLVGGIIGTSAGMAWAVRERDDKAAALLAETEEREAKERALAAEKQARDRAMDALRAMTDDIVENQMARGTTLTEENKEFLRKIIKHFEGLAASVADDADSRAIRAVGYLRVGLMRDRLGELKGAETAYAAALALYKQLAADFPKRPEFRQGLARSHSNLGILLEDKGQPKEAQAAYAAAFALRNQLAAEFPDHPVYRRDLAVSLCNQATLFKKTRRLEEAKESYAGALALFKQLAADFPERYQFLQELAVSHENMGGLLRDMGRLKEAAEAHSAACDILKQLASKFPHQPEYRQQLAICHISQGRLLWITGPLKDAESAFAAALALQKQLVDEFPIRAEFRVDLAHSYNNLGLVFAAMRRLPEAETALRAALHLRKQLASDLPLRSDIRQHLAQSHGNLGGVLEDTGRLKEAEEAYAAALSLSKQLAADFRDQPDLQNLLASALGNMAFFRLKMRDFPRAKSLLEEAAPHHQVVLKANPGNRTYRQFYGNNLAALVQAHAGLGNPAAATEVAQKLRGLGWDPPADTYNAACALALCVPIIQKNQQATKEARDKQVAFYGDEAMQMLQDAVAKGFKNAAHMKQDPDLRALGERNDFKKLLANLEADSGKK
jgi:serine/threonine protein kinase/tetratricopeptide (TPR) repeat protein